MITPSWRYRYTWRDRVVETALRPIGWVTWVITLPFRAGHWVAERVWNS